MALRGRKNASMKSEEVFIRASSRSVLSWPSINFRQERTLLLSRPLPFTLVFEVYIGKKRSVSPR